jgi:hypothetical protein
MVIKHRSFNFETELAIQAKKRPLCGNRAALTIACYMKILKFLSFPAVNAVSKD